MYYIIDGYNLFFQMFDKDPSIANRKNFVILISSMMKGANLIGEMIFDMPLHHETNYGHTSKEPPLTIIYAPKALEADDLIIEKLYALKKPCDVTIITSDKALIYKIKEQGANVMEVSSFLSLLKRKNQKSPIYKKPDKESFLQINRLETIFLKKLQDESE